MKIVAASCCKLQTTNPQPVWREIQAERPDALLLLGDNIYLDHDAHDDPAALSAELRRLYAAQLAEPAFAALLADLRARHAPVIAVYDDHDFLGNNRYGGDHPPALREAARAELLRALAPATTGQDVYHAHRLGLVDLIVLDGRFYRTHPARSGADRDAVLGQLQWQWFEEAVHASTAPYLLVASGTTVHRWGDESWEQYPGAFQRLLQLVGRRRGALVVSGDVHQNAAYDDSGLVEIVTSAVARRGLVFGRQRRNYGVLRFDPQQLDVDLRSDKVQWRMHFQLPLANWTLP
jgi:alkaline phosphatase D